MKRFTYSAMVALLTLGVLTTPTDVFAQLSKKEQKELKKAQKLEARQALIEQLRPSAVTFTFDSQPQGAKVIVDGRVIGVTPVTAKIATPNTIPNIAYATVSTRIRKTVESNQFDVIFLKDGYAQGVQTVKPDVDALGRFTWPSGVFHILEHDTRASTYGNDTSIPQGEAYQVVNRDTPGRTALEQTIIRWMIDSEPRGARVFWRVVSNCPAQVKNTNESYLGTTPYEDTRSFAIQGLTYENSRDVQIEIKITRAGYIDQVKRFNVRQAIDQMEISTFFDLVKREE